MIHTEPKLITAEKAVKMLKKEHIEINPKQAQEIVSFMYLLAEIYLLDGHES